MLKYNENQINDIAEDLRRCYTTGIPMSPVRERLSDCDVDTAYAIQDANTLYWSDAGRRVVGRKIGLTSLAVQRQLGVNQPDFGILFADMIVGQGQGISLARLIQPKVETEFALILIDDIVAEDPTVADLVRATGFVAPAFEIVDSRIVNWDIGLVDTIADNASCGLVVIGGPFRMPTDIDLRASAMTMRRGEELVSRGCGADCMGHPLNAAVWLAGEMSRRGRPLRAGEIILTGALGPMVSVTAGDQFEASIDGIGSVNVSFLE